VASLANSAINTGYAAGDTYISIENLTGSGFNDVLNGNNSANVVNGAAGNDTIKGYNGNDVLTGGAGNDTFVFSTAPNAGANVETITDFSAPNDTIALDDFVFTAIGAPGVLAAGAFYTGTAAHDSSDRIIYNAGTGALSYDADGTSGVAAILIAILNAALGLTNADFAVI
jgi:serralysin